MGRLPKVTLDEARAAYIQACTVAGSSPSWVYQQGVIVSEFSRHLEKQGLRTLATAEVHHLTKYLAAQLGRGLAKSTVHRHGTVIRSWAKWTVKSGVLKRAPLSRATLNTPDPPPLELPPFADILAAILATENRDHRDLFLVLLGSGLWRGELLALRWRDCDLPAGVLEVKPQKGGWSPKSGRGRAVGIPP